MESRKHFIQHSKKHSDQTHSNIDHFLRTHWKLVLTVLCIGAILVTGGIIVISLSSHSFHQDVQLIRNTTKENTVKTTVEDMESRNFLSPTEFSNLNSSVTTTKGKQEVILLFSLSNPNTI
jgi:hypothetical protein